MYTANTMASAIETMGMSLPYRYLKKLFLLLGWEEKKREGRMK
jgi:Dehydratase family